MRTESPEESVNGLASDWEVIDIQLVREDIDAVLSLKHPIPQRGDIDRLTLNMVEHLRRLLQEDLGYVQDPVVRTHYQCAYRHLALDRRPAADETSSSAWSYAREVARQVAKFADLYAELNGDLHHD